MAIQPIMAMERDRQFNGKDPKAAAEASQKKRSNQRLKQRERAQDKAMVEHSRLRALREKRRDELNSAMRERGVESNIPQIMDGPAVEHISSNPDGSQGEEGADGALSEDSRCLNRPRTCYICKRKFRELHHFYDLLCPDCAQLNFRKRNQTTNLFNKTALVTGGRIKIGFQSALWLLRCGCTVIVTSRFPRTAATAYSALDDFEIWKDRLHIYGLDFRDGDNSVVHFPFHVGVESFILFFLLRSNSVRRRSLLFLFGQRQPIQIP
jgi:hypothetical protein